MQPRSTSRAIGVLAIAGLVIGSWACGAASELDRGRGDDGSVVDDSPVDEGGPDGCGGCIEGGYDSVYESGYDTGFEDAYDVSPRDGGPDVRPPPDSGFDVIKPPPDTGIDVRPPPDSGFDVIKPPPDTGIDVIKPPDSGTDVIKPPPDTGVDVIKPPPDSGPDTEPPWDGGPPVTVATHESAQTLAVDDSYIYWENSGGTVLDCPVTGCPSNVPSLLSFNGYGYGFETLAAADSTAFYLDNSSDIDTCASGGCGLAPTLYSGTGGYDGGFPEAGYFYYQSLITDSVNAYFSDGTSVYQCALGATCSSPATLASVSIYASIGQLAVSPTDVFFVRQGSYSGAIRSIPIGGGTEQTLCKGYVLSYVQSMVQAGGYVYFTSGYVSTSIYQCPVTGGSPTVFATDVAPYGLATDGANLYWTNYTTGGSVVACAAGASCASPRTVASGQDYPQAIAVNSTRVFWATTADIYSAVK